MGTGRWGRRVSGGLGLGVKRALKIAMPHSNLTASGNHCSNSRVIWADFFRKAIVRSRTMRQNAPSLDKTITDPYTLAPLYLDICSGCGIKPRCRTMVSPAVWDIMRKNSRVEEIARRILFHNAGANFADDGQWQVKPWRCCQLFLKKVINCFFYIRISGQKHFLPQDKKAARAASQRIWRGV